MAFGVKKQVSDCVRRNFKSDADGAFNWEAEDALIAGPRPDLMSSRWMWSSSLYSFGWFHECLKASDRLPYLFLVDGRHGLAPI